MRGHHGVPGQVTADGARGTHLPRARLIRSACCPEDFKLRFRITSQLTQNKNHTDRQTRGAEGCPLNAAIQKSSPASRRVGLWRDHQNHNVGLSCVFVTWQVFSACSTLEVDAIPFLFYESEETDSVWRGGRMVSEGYRRGLASSGLRASQVLVLITCGAQFSFLPFVSKHSSDSLSLASGLSQAWMGVSCNLPTPG